MTNRLSTSWESWRLLDCCIINLRRHSTMRFFSSPKTITRRHTTIGRSRSKSSAKIGTPSSNQKVTTADPRWTPTLKHTKIHSIDRESTRASIYNRSPMLRSSFLKRWIPVNRKVLNLRTRRMSHKLMPKLANGSFTLRLIRFLMFQRTIIFLSSPTDTLSTIGTIIMIRRILIPRMLRNRGRNNRLISILKPSKETLLEQLRIHRLKRLLTNLSSGTSTHQKALSSLQRCLTRCMTPSKSKWGQGLIHSIILTWNSKLFLLFKPIALSFWRQNKTKWSLNFNTRARFCRNHSLQCSKMLKLANKLGLSNKNQTRFSIKR